MASSSAPRAGGNDGAAAPRLAYLDNTPPKEDECDKEFLPHIGGGAVNVKLRSRGGDSLRHGDCLRSDLELESPLVARDGTRLGLDLPWPAMMNEKGEIVGVPAVDRDECLDVGTWAERPGQHPLVSNGGGGWPAYCDGTPAEMMEYNPDIGTRSSRDGHPIIYKPTSLSGCSYSPVWNFSHGSSGSLPVKVDEALSIGLLNENCCCELQVKIDVLYTFNFINFQLPRSASPVNISLKGYLANVGDAPRCWTFLQQGMSTDRNQIFTGNASYVITIPPKSGRTINVWSEVGFGRGGAIQPEQYNLSLSAEACWSSTLHCP